LPSLLLMQYFSCYCHNTLFFENSQCLACGREVGWCPVCKGMHALFPKENGRYQCSNQSCGALLVKCHNYQKYDVCNRTTEAAKLPPNDPDCRPLCDYCRFTEVIPDLSEHGNIQ